MGAMRRRAETHHASERLHEPLPCGDGSTFLGLGTGTTWAGFLLPDQMQQAQQPQPLQRGFLNCFFWCGGPSSNVVGEDEDLEDEEDLAVGLPDVSLSPKVLLYQCCSGQVLCEEVICHSWSYHTHVHLVLTVDTHPRYTAFSSHYACTCTGPDRCGKDCCCRCCSLLFAAGSLLSLCSVVDRRVLPRASRVGCGEDLSACLGRPKVSRLLLTIRHKSQQSILLFVSCLVW